MENSQDKEDKILSFSSEKSEGALYQTIQTERKVKIFAVTESELTNISLFNTIAIVLFSIGSICLGITLTIALDYVMSESPVSKEMQDAVKFIAIPSFMFALIFDFFGGWAILKKKSDFKKIQSESEAT